MNDENPNQPKRMKRKSFTEKPAEASTEDAIRLPSTLTADDNEINKRVHGLLLDAKARKLVKEIQADGEFKPPEYQDTLQDELASQIDDPKFGIEGLVISGGNALITAPRKAGKTVLAINLAMAYVDNEPFLGQFKVTPLPDEGRVLMLNYELTRQQFGDWASRIGIENTDSISTLHLRGQAFKLKSPRAQKWLVELCKRLNVRVIIVDPLSRASSGFGSSNSNDDMDAFTEILDEIKLQAGVRELFLTNHMGWGVEERTRGASSLEGWPDALWRLNMKDNDRYFSVPLGRDVELDEGKLEFDPETKRLTFEDGVSRNEARNEAANQRVEELVLEFVRANPGKMSDEVEKEAKGASKQDIGKARMRLIDKGPIYTKPEGKKKLHYVRTIEEGPDGQILIR